jgi:hypothetical protein
VTIDARNPMWMCNRICEGGKLCSTIAFWTESTPDTKNVCLIGKSFWDNINVGYVSGLPTDWHTLATVSFQAGDEDIFYGTDLELDNSFVIVGRSSMMDREYTAEGNPRPDAPAKCPGVP